MKNESKLSNLIVLPCTSVRSMARGNQGYWASCSPPKVVSGHFFEILESTYPNTRCHNPQDQVVALHWRLKPKHEKSAFIFLTYFSLFLSLSFCHLVSIVPSIIILNSFFLCYFYLFVFYGAFLRNITTLIHYLAC